MTEIKKYNTADLPFGGIWSHDCVCAFGARGIYKDHGRHIDFPGDRMGWLGYDEAMRLGLVDWLNTTVMKLMLNYFRREQLPESSDKVWTFDDGWLHVMASPNASYGYLYVQAWIEVPEEA